MIFFFIVSILLIFIGLLMYLIICNKTKSLEQFNKQKKINFLHIPKNAGSSIMALYKNEINLLKHCKSFPQKDSINLAIIRHPETRIQSIFAHIKDRDNKKKSYDLNEFNTLDDLAKAYYNKNHKNHNKAHKLLDWSLEKYKGYNNTEGCSNNGCPEKKACLHWCPQHLFVYGHDAKVDYLLKFENLNTDLKKLIDLGVLENKELIHKNKSFSKYKELTELTPICKRLVKDIYRKDFELWEKAGLN
jgi:hypothetical protein